MDHDQFSVATFNLYNFQLPGLKMNGTVALRVDLVALQEIFRLTVAPRGQTAALSD